MSLGGSIRGVRPGAKALRNEREIADDPDREAKLQMYQRRAEIGAPLFDPGQVTVDLLVSARCRTVCRAGWRGAFRASYGR